MRDLFLFCGHDPREAIGFHVFIDSVMEHSPKAFICPMGQEQGDGTNAFTYSRFLVPILLGFKGWAVFADGADMMLRADLRELLELRDERFAVQVVKHDYQTKHPRKYVGTEMEATNGMYPRKNWSSLILWNCAHPAHWAARKHLTGQDGKFLHRFQWLKDEEIGSLPIEWNWLADEYGYNKDAKLLHWTAGVPGFRAYKDSPHAEEWRAGVRKVLRGNG